MKLLLTRKYCLDRTIGKLSVNGKITMYILEKAHKLFNPFHHCIPEGIYKVVPEYAEDSGWSLSVMNDSTNETYEIKAIQGKKIPDGSSLVPVTFFKEKRKPMYSNLANIKLRDRVFLALDEGEEVELEIVSETFKPVLKSCLQKKECI
ncbi:hypothetical protein SAMN00777080_3074 [Aquiflexum balticum DSM 16537]|uniref:DUF5675 domain-containing protein n=1 Tax=Aquiflexum balticum DSM 16537 TaxID=758820 RepID=A0A1W2H6B0_9BACT|nr:DUF5675 family protein [Aquiflexum balticum]SMD44453.1 hypothetical protein SAMN00777080_3074 [Aquiflexum balticum DSM 16537]